MEENTSTVNAIEKAKREIRGVISHRQSLQYLKELRTEIQRILETDDLELVNMTVKEVYNRDMKALEEIIDCLNSL